VTEQRFLVVRNDEEQYSIWAADRELPLGWHDAGFGGSRAECLSRVDEVWTDLRPRSLRLAATADTDGEG
jgi:MbtH protein